MPNFSIVMSDFETSEEMLYFTQNSGKFNPQTFDTVVTTSITDQTLLRETVYDVSIGAPVVTKLSGRKGISILSNLLSHLTFRLSANTGEKGGSTSDWFDFGDVTGNDDDDDDDDKSKDRAALSSMGVYSKYDIDIQSTPDSIDISVGFKLGSALPFGFSVDVAPMDFDIQLLTAPLMLSKYGQVSPWESSTFPRGAAALQASRWQLKNILELNTEHVHLNPFESSLRIPIGKVRVDRRHEDVLGQLLRDMTDTNSEVPRSMHVKIGALGKSNDARGDVVVDLSFEDFHFQGTSSRRSKTDFP
jgi:hypothetical protein